MIIICSLPDISAIGQVGGWRGCSPPAVRYRSTSSLFLPAYFPPSPLTKAHSNSNGALNAKPMYRKGSPTQRLVPKRKSTGAPSSHQSCSCGSKVTVNGQHHCDFLLYSPSWCDNYSKRQYIVCSMTNQCLFLCLSYDLVRFVSFNSIYVHGISLSCQYPFAIIVCGPSHPPCRTIFFLINTTPVITFAKLHSVIYFRECGLADWWLHVTNTKETKRGIFKRDGGANKYKQITFFPTHFKLGPRRQEVNDDYNAIAVAKRQQRRHNDNRAMRSVRVVSARCDQPTSLAYLVAQLDFQFMRNITWQKAGNKWAIGNRLMAGK